MNLASTALHVDNHGEISIHVLTCCVDHDLRLSSGDHSSGRTDVRLFGRRCDPCAAICGYALAESAPGPSETAILVSQDP